LLQDGSARVQVFAFLRQVDGAKRRPRRDPAGRGTIETQEKPEERGLPAAVRTDDPPPLAVRDIQVQLLEERALAEPDPEAPRLDHPLPAPLARREGRLDGGSGARSIETLDPVQPRLGGLRLPGDLLRDPAVIIAAALRAALD